MSGKPKADRGQIRMPVSRKRILISGLVVLWPLGYLLSRLTAFRPSWIEDYYSQGYAKILSGCLSRATGVFPFSLAEVSLYLFMIAFCLFLMRLIARKIVSTKVRMYQSKSGKLEPGELNQDKIKQAIKKKKGLVIRLLNGLIFLGIVYFSFLLIWGLNYNRLPFADIAGFTVGNASEKDLERLCEQLIDKANRLRVGLAEDEQGVMIVEEGFAEIRKSAPAAFTQAAFLYPELGGQFGLPKPVYASKIMSYSGISGIYFPFTGEANVNIDIPDSMLPATTCHEMAHQRGFAREDEANYIAWVACNSSMNKDFQYSGTLLALIHSINALYEHAPNQTNKLSEKYGEGLQRDLQAISQYWKQYEGKVEEFTSDVNDAYLKSNGQEEGVESYGRMVDLLLAEQRENSNKSFLP